MIKDEHAVIEFMLNKYFDRIYLINNRKFYRNSEFNFIPLFFFALKSKSRMMGIKSNKFTNKNIKFR